MQDIIIFGRGRYYKSKMFEVKNRYNIVAFIDNIVKPGTVLTNEDGIPVYNPENLKELPEAPIITMSVKFFEMWQQLKNLGVKDERIIFGITLRPFYDEIELLFSEQDIEVCSLGYELVLKSKKEILYRFSSEGEYKSIIRKLQRQRDANIRMIADMPMKPISRRCGYERGTPIDRYYIEKFLDSNQKYIQNKVMEVADNQYTCRYSKNIKEALIMHVEGWDKDVVQINLETGNGVAKYANSIDCFICTQTIQMIYDIKTAMKNIYKMLKQDGTALITIAGIAGISLYDYYNWGEYWRVTPKALRMIMEETFDRNKIEIFGYGNIKTTIAFLYGLCVEDLGENDFTYDDEQFPMLIGCVVRK